MTTTPISPAPTKVLIIDDEEANLDFFEQTLRAEKFTVVKAHDGIEGLDKFDKFLPDIVLCDLMMPRLNGYDVCARLKHNPRAKGVPIILLTALAEEEAKPAALASGASLFLNKPIHADTLLANVHALLRLRQAMRPT
jgi:DNA-binding response OmpR family regulator